MAVIILLFYVSRAGTREVHNKLEKNRSVVIKIFFYFDHSVPLFLSRFIFYIYY